jgi:hypothetical protein
MRLSRAHLEHGDTSRLLERVPSRCSDLAAQSVGENEDSLASPECSQRESPTFPLPQPVWGFFALGGVDDININATFERMVPNGVESGDSDALSKGMRLKSRLRENSEAHVRVT